MTATNHGLFGAVLAVTLHRYPAAAAVLALFSHCLLDALPHFGDDNMSLHSKKFYKILIFDCTLAVVSTLAVAWFWQDRALLVVVCAFLAASFDLMWLYFEYLKRVPRNELPWYARFHGWIQWSQTPSGAYVELAWFAFLFPLLIITGA